MLNGRNQTWKKSLSVEYLINVFPRSSVSHSCFRFYKSLKILSDCNTQITQHIMKFSSSSCCKTEQTRTCHNRWWCWGDVRWSAQCIRETSSALCFEWGHPFPNPQPQWLHQGRESEWRENTVLYGKFCSEKLRGQSNIERELQVIKTFHLENGYTEPRQTQKLLINNWFRILQLSQ